MSRCRRGKTADGHLRDLTKAGLKWRYPDGTPFKVARLAVKELRFIAEQADRPLFPDRA